jgi:hypothetical protein
LFFRIVCMRTLCCFGACCVFRQHRVRRNNCPFYRALAHARECGCVRASVSSGGSKCRRCTARRPERHWRWPACLTRLRHGPGGCRASDSAVPKSPTSAIATGAGQALKRTLPRLLP